MIWSVYIIRCSDESLYTGITTDVERRFYQHMNQKGAKYFRTSQPVEIVFVETGYDRSSASRREAQIKRLSRVQKLHLIANNSPIS